jgi:hypothetical protein
MERGLTAELDPWEHSVRVLSYLETGHIRVHPNAAGARAESPVREGEWEMPSAVCDAGNRQSPALLQLTWASSAAVQTDGPISDNDYYYFQVQEKSARGMR